ARPTVEVAHEALIRTWPRLRSWIDANRDKLRARAAILQAKAEWEQHGRREDLLLPPGFQLERARALLAEPGDLTVDDIQEFITSSSASEEAERKQREDLVRQRQEEQEKQRERELKQARELADAQQKIIKAQRKATRRLLIGLGASILLAIFGLGQAYFVGVEKSRAEAKSQIARLQSQLAQLNNIKAAYTKQPEALAIEANKVVSKISAENERIWSESLSKAYREKIVANIVEGLNSFPYRTLDSKLRVALYAIAAIPEENAALNESLRRIIAENGAPDIDQLGALTGRDQLISIGVRRIARIELNQDMQSNEMDECSLLRRMEIPVFQILEWDDSSTSLVCPFPFLAPRR